MITHIQEKCDKFPCMVGCIGHDFGLCNQVQEGFGVGAGATPSPFPWQDWWQPPQSYACSSQFGQADLHWRLQSFAKDMFWKKEEADGSILLIFWSFLLLIFPACAETWPSRVKVESQGVPAAARGNAYILKAKKSADFAFQKICERVRKSWQQNLGLLCKTF